MKQQRKCISKTDLEHYCDERHRLLGSKACTACPMILRISASSYCLRSIRKLQEQINDFLCGEVEMDLE